MPDFTAFLSYVLVASFAPGPNCIISMSNASRYGFRKSIMFNVGIFCGVLLVFALCSVFSMALYNIIPAIKPVMASAGASYIIWLAWKTYQSKPDHKKKEEVHTNTFSFGIFLQFVNPNVILYGVTAMSGFIVPYYHSWLELAVFSVLLALIGFVATCCWALFGSAFQRHLDKNFKAVNTVMALLLVYCAISLFL